MIHYLLIVKTTPKVIVLLIADGFHYLSKAITKRQPFYTHNGETHNLKEWSRILNFDYTLAKSRRKEAKRKNISPTFEYVFAPNKRVHKSK